MSGQRVTVQCPKVILAKVSFWPKCPSQSVSGQSVPAKVSLAKVSLWPKCDLAQKCIFGIFWLFLSFFRRASRPYTLSYINALHIIQSIWEIFEKIFLELAIWKNELFLSRPFRIFLLLPMKISPNLYGRMDGTKFWCFPWIPENSSLCVILRYTVYTSNYLLSWKKTRAKSEKVQNYVF